MGCVSRCHGGVFVQRFGQKMSLLAIKYHRGHLEILNQLLIPHETVYEEITCVEDGWQAIRSMKVRFRGTLCMWGLWICLPFNPFLSEMSFNFKVKVPCVFAL